MSTGSSLFLSIVGVPLVCFFPGHLLFCAFHRRPPEDLSLAEHFLFRVTASLALVSVVAYLLAVVGHFSLPFLIIIVLAALAAAKLAFRIPLSLSFLPRPKKGDGTFFIVCLLAASLLGLLIFPLSEWVSGEGEIGIAYNGGLMISQIGSLFFTDEGIQTMDPVHRALFIGTDFLDTETSNLFYGYNFTDIEAGRILPYHANMNCIFFALTDVLIGRVPPSWTQQFFHLLSLIAIFCLGKRLFGKGVGGLSALLLSINYIQFFVIREEGIDLVGQAFAWTGFLALVVFYEGRHLLVGTLSLIATGLALSVKVDLIHFVLIIVIYLFISRPSGRFDRAHRFYANGLLAVGLLFLLYVYFIIISYWRLTCMNNPFNPFPELCLLPEVVFPFFAAGLLLSAAYFNVDGVVSLLRGVSRTRAWKILGRFWKGHRRPLRNVAVMVFVGVVLLSYCKGMIDPPWLIKPQSFADTQYLDAWEEFGMQMYRVSWVFGGPLMLLGLFGFCQAVMNRRTGAMVIFFGWIYVVSYLFYLVFGIRSPFNTLPFFYRYSLLIVVPITILFLSAGVFRLQGWVRDLFREEDTVASYGDGVQRWTSKLKTTLSRGGVAAVIGAALLSWSLWIDQPFFRAVHHGGMREKLDAVAHYLDDDIAIFGTSGFGWRAKMFGIPLKFVYLRDVYALYYVSDVCVLSEIIGEWMSAGRRVYLADLDYQTKSTLSQYFDLVPRVTFPISFLSIASSNYRIPLKNEYGEEWMTFFEAIAKRSTSPYPERRQERSIERGE